MRLRSLLRHPFDRVSITPLGRFFSIFTLLFGIAAINSGNNLLYFILAYLLMLLFASGILSTINILGIEVEFLGQDELFRGEEGNLYLSVRKKKYPSFLLHVCTDAGCSFLPYVGKEKKEISVPILSSKRGIKKLEKIYVYSIYPFGFARRGIYVSLNAEYLVYPRIDLPVYDEKDKYIASWGERYGSRKGYEGEFRGLRRYETGDRLFHIHWKKSVKELNVKEFEGVETRVIYITIPRSHDDKIVDEVASFAHLILRKGESVGLLMEGNILVPPGKGEEHEKSILRVLALL